MARDGERGRGDGKRLGSQNSGPYAETSGDSGPVDIAAVRRDDALIDAISGDGPVQTGTSEEYQLAALLADWRAEILEEPMPAGPDLDTIVAAVNQEIGARDARIGAQAGRGRLRLVRPLLGAAAALALVFGGLTAFSYSAEPGDPLWRVKEVVFSEQAQTTVVARADSDLAEAQLLISQNRPEEAKAVMERASANAGQVNDSGKKDDLLDRWQQLYTQLQEIAPTIASSLAPVPTTTAVKPTTNPAVSTTPDNTVLGTTLPNTPGGGDTTTDDPRGIDTLPGTVPPTGGPVTPLPETPGPSTVPTQPSVDSPPPSTVPGTGGTTSPASLPEPGGTLPPGGPVTAPSAEQPSVPAPVVPPQTLPSAGGGLPNVPSVPGVR
ncbi:anti-sigma-D factor RsdA [Nocardia sp. NPDC055321]